MASNQFYRPISRDYSYLNATLKNTRNSWGAYTHDLQNIVLTSWVDYFDEEQMRITAVGDKWKLTPKGTVPPGYRERLGHLDAIRGGVPFYVLVATDKNHAQQGRPGHKRKLDPRVPRRCFKGIGLEQAGSTTYAILGEEVNLMDLQDKFVHEKDHVKANYLKQRAKEAGLSTPIIDGSLIESYEREMEARRVPRDPEAPSCVYVISQKGGGDHFKVGMSKNPDKRLKQLQTGNPFELELEAQSVTMTALQAFAWETLIQDSLPNRLMGEWFEAKAIKKASNMTQAIHEELMLESEALIEAEKTLQAAA